MPAPLHSTFTAKFLRQRRRSAFTLIEMMAAVAIIGVVFIALYGFLAAQLDAMRIIEQGAQREGQLEGFRKMMRHWAERWESPASTALVGQPHVFGSLPADDMAFTAWPGNSVFSAEGEGRYRVTLLLRAGGEHKGELGIRRTLEGTPDNSDDEWLPLLDNIRALEIRYWDTATSSWANEWNNNAALPRLLRVRIWPNEAIAPYEFIVTVPPRRVRL